MPYVRVWIHYVWSTKNRQPVLNDQIRPVIFNHMKLNAVKKNIHLDCVNGYVDHAHCLVSLGSQQTISNVIQLIKGESACWANKQRLIPIDKLLWQDEYFAVSVSESGLDAVRRYILNQEEHHKKKSFTDEYNELISRYGTPIKDSR